MNATERVYGKPWGGGGGVNSHCKSPIRSMSEEIRCQGGIKELSLHLDFDKRMGNRFMTREGKSNPTSETVYSKGYTIFEMPAMFP